MDSGKNTEPRLLIILLCGLLAVSVFAAPEEPVITMQPQSPNYPEYSVATYTVKATGTNLTATWYIEYQGKTYNASQIGGTMQPWEAYAGESYGAKKLDNNTFCFVFEGIEDALSGAEIWCEIEDGHYSVVSQVGHITVGNYGSPPEILDIPAQITVKRGEDAEIRCIAKSTDESQLNFLWYETGTGKFEDMQAINRGAETGDFMFCDTRTVGTCYYVCGITTSGGGMAYSSMVEVNVVANDTTTAAPKIQTETLPDATVGTQYAVQLKCTDSEAEFFPYYNPGTRNDLEEGSWLGLSIDGWLMGTPTQAGTYSFTVCAMGAGGEDYGVYTLTVVEAAPQETTEATVPATQTGATEPAAKVTDPTTASTTESGAQEATTDTKAVVDTPPTFEQPQQELPWWVLALVGLVAAGIGVGVAIILTKKK